MSRSIILYSEDKKYKCSVELSDINDRFGCPDHSMLVLFEEIENELYLIAQVKDKYLETEKDLEIDQLKQQLAEDQAKVLDLKMRLKGSTKELDKMVNDILHEENQRLRQQLAEKNKEIERLEKVNVVNAVQSIKDIYKSAEQNSKQLAIQKLEKVKNFVDDIQTDLGNDYMIDRFSVLNLIDQQIKELKGEK